MLKLISAGAVIVASAAWGLGLAVGAFGGAAEPTGEMASAGITPYDGSNLAWSLKAGGKTVITVWRGIQAEAAIGYHFGHAPNVWPGNDFVEEPASTLIPVTVGANYRFDLGKIGLYVGGGGGYYFERLRGGVLWNALHREYMNFTTDVSLNGPGVYAGGGITYTLGSIEFDVSPRYNVIFNAGVYELEGSIWDPDGYRLYIQLGGHEKEYNDTYAELLVGLNYYFM